jgi:hypothetical protein
MDFFRDDTDDYLDDDFFDSLFGRQWPAVEKFPRRWERPRREYGGIPARGQVKQEEELLRPGWTSPAIKRTEGGGRQQAADVTTATVTKKPDEALEGVYQKIRQVLYIVRYIIL